MRTISAEDVVKDWLKVATDARQEPVCVQGSGDDVILMSRRQYQRLTKQGWDDLFRAMDKMAETAAARGLTEEKLEELLADES